MNPPAASEKSFARTAQSLQAIFEFVREYFGRQKIEAGHLFAVEFAIEELFTNLVKYNRDNTNDILVRLERVGHELAVSLTDFDVEPFDVNQAPPVRVDRPIEDRQPGGLGIHLVKKLVDRIDYDYADRTSKTTFFKSLEP